MNKISLLVVFLLLANCLSFNVNAKETNEIVNIPDECLQSIIREKINKPKGDILKKDLESITSLEYVHHPSNMENYFSSNRLKSPFIIYDLEGIQYCTNLKELDLSSNSIKDVSKLVDLKKLQYLNLSQNPLVDISGIEKLDNLLILNISHTMVNDIKELKYLNNIKELFLYKSPISDYTPISSYYNKLIDRDFDLNCIDINININGSKIITDTQPIIDNGRVMIPIRNISENFGYYVDWNEQRKIVIIEKYDMDIERNIKIELSIGNKIADVNGKKVSLDSAPRIFGRRTLVPIRFIAETFKATVSWDEQSRTVNIKEY